MASTGGLRIWANKQVEPTSQDLRRVGTYFPHERLVIAGKFKLRYPTTTQNCEI